MLDIRPATAPSKGGQTISLKRWAESGRLARAALLDRVADAALSCGQHRLAETLSHSAAEMRDGAR